MIFVKFLYQSFICVALRTSQCASVESNHPIPFLVIGHRQNMDGGTYSCRLVGVQTEFYQSKCFALAWSPFGLATAKDVLRTTRLAHKELTACMVRPSRAKLKTASIAPIVVSHHCGGTELKGRTAAVTGRPPIGCDFRTHVVGRSGSRPGSARVAGVTQQGGSRGQLRLRSATHVGEILLDSVHFGVRCRKSAIRTEISH